MPDDHCCPWYMAYFFDNPLRKIFQDPAKIVGPYLQEGKAALDLGCGMGYFSIAMAKMVGESGKVFSMDVQEKMHRILLSRARRQKVEDRITPILAKADEFETPEKVDFAIAMWMVHEVPDPETFLKRVKLCLKEGGAFMIAEPSMHVKKDEFEGTIRLADKVGFKVENRPKVGLSLAAVFRA